MKKLLTLCILLFSLNHSFSKEKTFVIFGEGDLDFNIEDSNQDALTKLLDKIKEQNPLAVFYTGNLIKGLEQSTTPESLNLFKEELNLLTAKVQQHLGATIPFYTVIGNENFINSEAVTLFSEHFNITKTLSLEKNVLAYSINIEDVQFIILATGTFDRVYRGHQYNWRRKTLIDWINESLQTNQKNIKYHIMVSHQPIFRPSAPTGLFLSEKKEKTIDNQFWKTLTDNNVLVYFCSDQLLYDRSNRSGTWQIISGGVGSKGDDSIKSDRFNHFIKLTIPEKKEGFPLLEAIDIKGNIWDKLDLKPEKGPLQQLRIS